MRQFYETYRGDETVSAVLRQLPWTHNLLILSKSKRPEEREFYLRMATSEKWSSRELERQLKGALFERVVLSPVKVSPPVTQFHPDAASVFKDAYLVNFLELPAAHSEGDLQRALMANLRQFLLELGGDFTFVGERYRLQVGGRDFFVDLLFYHRGLSCLVAFELKVDQFEPADLGQHQFYLEALDRDIKKPHERPSIGVLLCSTKDHKVVEYALSRTMSPALVAEYQTRLNEALAYNGPVIALARVDEAGACRPESASRHARRTVLSVELRVSVFCAKEGCVVSLEYVNRRGDRYFVLQGKTKTGKPKFYCSKRPGGVGVDRLPEDFEIYENPQSALVSVRKVRPTRIQPFERDELTRLAKELAGAAVLVAVEGDSLVVYASEVDPMASGRLIGLILGDGGKGPPGHTDWVARHAHYAPMLRFTLSNEDERLYSLERWCYLGSIDGWIPLKCGKPLERLANDFLPHLGRESFFELM